MSATIRVELHDINLSKVDDDLRGLLREYEIDFERVKLDGDAERLYVYYITGSEDRITLAYTPSLPGREWFSVTMDDEHQAAVLAEALKARWLRHFKRPDPKVDGLKPLVERWIGKS